MIVPPPIAPSHRRGEHRARLHEPDWSSLVAGTGAFLVVAAACLFLVAHLAP